MGRFEQDNRVHWVWAKLWNKVEKGGVWSPVKEIGSKLATLCNWARDNGSSSCSKHKLKAKENMISELSCASPGRTTWGTSHSPLRSWSIQILHRRDCRPLHRPIPSLLPSRMWHRWTRPTCSWWGCWQCSWTWDKTVERFRLKPFITSLTVPASRKANPHCMMKIMMLVMTRKRASSSSASRSSWSASSRVLFPRPSKCFCSTNSKSKSDMMLMLLRL